MEKVFAIFKANFEKVKADQAEEKAYREKFMTIFRTNREDVVAACQETTEVCPEKMEPNSGEKEAVVEWQEIPNEEATIYSMSACQK
jgi:hypothetical protein